MKKHTQKILYGLIIVFIFIQLIPVDKSNPKTLAEIQAPSDVKTILKNSCYDCHSNQTSWPWYSYVAPVSFLVSKDVKDGRRHLNFSIWENLSAEKKADKLDEIWEEVEDGEMPMPIYTFMHTKAKLTEAQKSIIKNWTRGGGNSNSMKSHTHEHDED